MVTIAIISSDVSKEAMASETIQGFNAEDVLILSCPEVDSNPPGETKFLNDTFYCCWK